MEAIQYKGYTIHPSWSPFGGYDYFPTEEGMDEDNVRRADTLEEAKDEISEKIMTSMPQHEVRINHRVYFFDWIVDTIKFADYWKADHQIQSI